MRHFYYFTLAGPNYSLIVLLIYIKSIMKSVHISEEGIFMEKRRVLALIAAALFIFFTVAPAGADFIGTGVTFAKDFSDSINVNVAKIAGLDDTAFAGVGTSIGVSWDVPVNINVLAGYPYGYGGVGVVTTGNTGYALGLNMDMVQTSGFDGSDFGIPLAQQGTTSTHFGKLWAAENQIDNTQAFLPFSSFPVL
ncbi:hypothetical protein MCP_1696 [Methanocella paludicola SANAE]|uniref:Uncharacterized protein n=2 Tax=Methanocella TaxID=570266 RepID=D1YZ96_METPS|nr:hypothetical protein MCP_1696 [Methanocella paludicola SANAE]